MGGVCDCGLVLRLCEYLCDCGLVMGGVCDCGFLMTEYVIVDLLWGESLTLL